MQDVYPMMVVNPAPTATGVTFRATEVYDDIVRFSSRDVSHGEVLRAAALLKKSGEKPSTAP